MTSSYDRHVCLIRGVAALSWSLFEVRKLGPALALATGAMYATSASSQPSDNLDEGNIYIVTLGASTEFGPSYPGASRHSFSVMPDFDWRRMGEAEELSAPDDNLDLSLLDWGQLSAGPVIGFRDSRDEKDMSVLKGLKKIRPDADAGIFARYWIVPDEWRVRTEVRKAVFNGSGLQVDMGSDYFVKAGERWIFTAGPRASFASKPHMKTYFGVSAEEAQENGKVEPFDPSGGLQSAGISVSASYSLDDAWTLQAYGRYDRLLGDARRSPISRDIGSADQWTLGFGITKAFTVNF